MWSESRAVEDGWSLGARRKEVEEFYQTIYILVIFRSFFFSFFIQDSSDRRWTLPCSKKKKREILCIPLEDGILSPAHTALSNIKRRKTPFHGRRCFVAPFTFLEGGRKKAAARCLRAEGTTPCKAWHHHLHHSDW